MSSALVKVFGERNTGTRAVGAMLAQLPHVRRRINTAPRPVDGRVEAAIMAEMSGSWRRLYLHALRDARAAEESALDPWKHSAPTLTQEMIAAQARTICLHRNPYSWFLSFARRPYHMKGPPAPSLEAFLNRPWMTERRERVAAVLPSPMMLWGIKLSAAEVFRAEARAEGLACVFLGFEEFVQSPVASLGAALAALDVPAEGLREIRTNTKQGDVDRVALAAYYSEERWKKDLTAPLVSGINALVDWDQAARLGYARLSAEDFPEALPAPRAAEIAREISSLAAPMSRAG